MSSSRKLFDRAQRKIPGGVNSPVRAWKAVGGHPRFIKRGKGPTLTDVDGKSYVDYLGSWGAAILGHAHPKVVAALRRATMNGTTFGAPTVGEVELAEVVSRLMPSIEQLRLVNSGTEATMSALRLARAFTRRSKILKFDGCYHGHADGLLVRAGSGVATFALPDSAGVPQSFAEETLVAEFNDITSIESVFKKVPGEIACVIVEPVCGNMGVISPAPGFLAGLRTLTQHYGALLIFDEVITGFRLSAGGAQRLYDVKPDLTCVGKVLGGGLPLAGFGGRTEIMGMLAPEGPVYQAGTLSGNPMAVAAGLATLQVLARPRVYDRLESLSAALQKGLETILQRYGIPAAVNRVGSMLTLFFGVESVRSPAQARDCDRERFGRFFHGMLRRGIYFPPAPLEAAFVSVVHGQREIDRTLNAFENWARAERRG